MEVFLKLQYLVNSAKIAAWLVIFFYSASLSQALDLEDHSLTAGWPLFSYQQPKLKVYSEPDFDSSFAVWSVIPGEKLDYRRMLVKNIEATTITLSAPLTLNCHDRKTFLTQGQEISLWPLNPQELLARWGKNSTGEFEQSCQLLRQFNRSLSAELTADVLWWLQLHHNQNFQKGWIEVSKAALRSEFFANPNFETSLTLLAASSHHLQAGNLDKGLSGKYDNDLYLIFDEEGQNFNGFLADNQVFYSHEKNFVIECKILLSGKKNEDHYLVNWWFPGDATTGSGKLRTSWQGVKLGMIIHLDKIQEKCPAVLMSDAKPAFYPLQYRFFGLNLKIVALDNTPVMSAASGKERLVVCLNSYSPLLISHEENQLMHIKDGLQPGLTGYIQAKRLFQASDLPELILEAADFKKQSSANDSTLDQTNNLCLAE